MAATGSILAALRAGKVPEKIPESTINKDRKETIIKTAKKAILISISVVLSKPIPPEVDSIILKSLSTPTPKNIPIKPKNKVIIMASKST